MRRSYINAPKASKREVIGEASIGRGFSLGCLATGELGVAWPSGAVASLDGQQGVSLQIRNKLYLSILLSVPAAARRRSAAIGLQVS